ncbi:MAG: carbamoyltransferase HypF [Deltaproteobacteria bacterium]|nr:carbamoyltransferase HypF [Deltaproteobacteria bacterium]
MQRENLKRLRIQLEGRVQGVGLRPYVFRLAQDLRLGGWVANSSAGVSIEIEGSANAIANFLKRFPQEKPTHALFQHMYVQDIEIQGEAHFEILPSFLEKKSTALLPDLATCSKCLEDIFDPKNRRYQYPFTNCTKCGPRFSIIEEAPYDRSRTSMRNFAMCEACQEEYDDPQDRRFHAQPNACAECGPQLRLWDKKGAVLSENHRALLQSAEAIREGKIVAVKGLGGFHFIVSAYHGEAVASLRARKHRKEKAFAVMFSSLQSLKAEAEVSSLEETLLLSAAAPIVLLKRKKISQISPQVAPQNPLLGAMLAYTPLHHLLIRELGFPLVVTSANLSGESICYDEKNALERFQGIADLFLVHDRPIIRHVDDSVLRVIGGREMMLRQARGYAPLTFEIEESCESVLALGGQMKNSVAFSYDKKILLSQYIGELQTAEARKMHRRVLQDYANLYQGKTKYIATDMHPDYFSTQEAKQWESPQVQVQHHHAHLASCMLEHGLRKKVLGVLWDGTGLGENHELWGGEFFLATRADYERVGHLMIFPLLGGEQAIYEIRRIAISLLYQLFNKDLFSKDEMQFLFEGMSQTKKSIFTKMLEERKHSQLTSSMGRLFDGVASILELRQKVSFEAQAAMELEFLADQSQSEQSYCFPLFWQDSKWIADWKPVLLEILQDKRDKIELSEIARKFHNSLAELVCQLALKLGQKQVILSGGCFQNKLLTEIILQRLKKKGFEVFWHHRVPPNDGGIALGQAIVAIDKMQEESK